MIETKKKLSSAVLAVTVMVALALGGLGLTGMTAAPAFADEPAAADTATPAPAEKPKPAMVKVKYKGVSGAKNTNPAEVAKGTTIKLKTPSKAGYTFKGWYQGKKKVTKVKASKTVTLTAKWQAKTYKIVYKDVKGVKVTTAKKFTYGKSVKLKNLKKSGYTFCGWYSDN